MGRRHDVQRNRHPGGGQASSWTSWGFASSPYTSRYYTADAVEAVTTLGSQSDQGRGHCVQLHQCRRRYGPGRRVDGLVIAWTAVEMARLHVDPLVIRAKCTIDATGHDLEVVKVLLRKNPAGSPSPPPRRHWRRALHVVGRWAKRAPSSTPKRFIQGFFVAGMAATATPASIAWGHLRGHVPVRDQGGRVDPSRLTAAKANTRIGLVFSSRTFRLETSWNTKW